MNLFSKPTPTDPAKIDQIKTWMYEYLNIDLTIPISVSQLRCSEPGCPPIETVIAVMTTPACKYKIHKPATQIEAGDIAQAVQG